MSYSCQDEGSRGAKCRSRLSLLLCHMHYWGLLNYTVVLPSYISLAGYRWCWLGYWLCNISPYSMWGTCYIYMHVLFAHAPDTTSSCSSHSTYHFRKSASQTSDHLLSAHLYMCSQELIVSLRRSWETVYELISQVLFFFRCFPVFRELVALENSTNWLKLVTQLSHKWFLTKCEILSYCPTSPRLLRLGGISPHGSNLLPKPWNFPRYWILQLRLIPWRPSILCAKQSKGLRE